MKVTNLYADKENAYLEIEEASFYIEIEEQKIRLPSEINRDTHVQQIKFVDLLNIVQKEGCFPIGIYSNGEFKRLRFEQFLKVRVSGRFFRTEDTMKKLYITKEGYLNFAYLSEKNLFFMSQSSSNIYATKIKVNVIDSVTYIGLVLDECIKDNVKGVSIVDFSAQKRYVVPHFFTDGVLNLDLKKAPRVGQYQIVIDSIIDERMDSQLVKMINSEAIEVDGSGDVAFCPFVMENDSLVIYSVRQEVDHGRKEIAIKSIGDAYGNSIEIEINLDDIGFTGVWTRCKRLNRNFELAHQYNGGKLRIDFSNFDGYTSGEFGINVNTSTGWYQLHYNQSFMLSESESDRHFFIRCTENSTRYAYFSEDWLLKYAIKPVSSYQKLSDKTLLFNSLCFLNNAFQIELCEEVSIQEVILGEGEILEFYQNGKILRVCIPNEQIITGIEYISVLSRGQSYKLKASSFLSDVSVQSKLVIFTCQHERLAIKPLDIEYYVISKKITKKLEVEVPNIRSTTLGLVVNSDIEIRKVIAINRRDLSFKELEFELKEQVLDIHPKGFEPFVVDSVENYVLDIVFVTNDGWVMPLVKKFKQLAANEKKQPWQISEQDCEMLHQVYINASGNISIHVKDNYYAENWEKSAIRENTILYEAFFGKKITDSCYAFFKYLIEHPQFKEFDHIWVIDDEQSQALGALDERYKSACRFVVRNTRAYKRALLEVKYLFCSSAFPGYFAKKDNQIYINTWHGTALKKLGYDTPIETTVNSRNTFRNFLMTDYIISPNPHMTKIFLNSYKLKGIYQGTILEGGYPRNDVMLVMDRFMMTEKMSSLLAKFDPQKPTILYAPTWSGADGFAPTDVDKLVNLRKFVTRLQKDYGSTHNILLKLHYFVFKFVCKEPILQELLVPDYIDTNEILLLVDVLITDFSSIFFDFLLTDKPVIFYVPDKADYLQERGTYLDLNDLPGPQVENYQQFQKELGRIIAGKRNKYLQKYTTMKEKYLVYEDGETTKRYVQRIFKCERSNKIKEFSGDSDKKRILMHIGGMVNHGITASALNLLNLIDYNRYDVTVIIMYMQRTEECLNNIEKINKHVRIKFAFGASLYSSSEVVKDEKLLKEGFSKEDWEIMEMGYRRDISYRILPNMHFDAVIEFHGYGKSASKNLLAMKSNRRLVYLHSEISKDSKKIFNDKFTHIDGFNTILTLYPYADKLVSVSRTLMKENFKALSHVMRVEQLAFAQNVIDYNYILEQSQKEIDLGKVKSICGNSINPIDTNTGLNFVASGRLSPEKNHIALIKAFVKLKRDYPKARLFILGKGPLQAEIAKEIKSAEMLGEIVMLGHLENPFSFISKMDYLVFPSLHEGQSMVLLEALVLEKKIMASNIKPNIDVLGDSKYGLLSKGTTPEALYEGLRTIISKPAFERFDYVKYNHEALDDFYKLIET